MGEGSGHDEDPEEDEPIDEDAVEGGASEENDGSTQAHKRNRSNESADEAEAEVKQPREEPADEAEHG